MKILLIVMLLVISIIPAFAQSPITFDVDTTKIMAGKIVELKGKVTENLEGQPVAVEIKDSNGNVILIRTVTSDENGNFVLKFKVPNDTKTGEFSIITSVELDGQSFSETKSIESIGSDVELTSQPTCGQGTESVNGVCQAIKTDQKGGGCLIATATYGSELAPQVQLLREIRDNNLLNTESGSAFMGTFNDIYYTFSPTIADYERENPYFKEAVKIAITPMLSTLSIMENANSESEVLGLGLSVIALNLAMYIGIPAIGIVKVIQFRKN